jgi:hypothetical protein
MSRLDRIAEDLSSRGVTFTYGFDAARGSMGMHFIRAEGSFATEKDEPLVILTPLDLAEPEQRTRARLLWALAVNVEHRATSCPCDGTGHCPAAQALARLFGR